MSALSDALTAAGITYAWARAPIEGRVCLWLYHGRRNARAADDDTGSLEDYANHVRLLAVKAYEATSMRFPTATGTVTNDAPPKGEKA